MECISLADRESVLPLFLLLLLLRINPITRKRIQHNTKAATYMITAANAVAVIGL